MPAFGALLHSFEVQLDEGSLNVVDNYPNIASLQKDLALSYKSSKLSPFACRIQNGQYVFNGQLFEFANKFNDGTAIHGLLYNKAFSVVDQFADAEQASVLLIYQYNKEDGAYPYAYRCEVRYTLLPGNVLKLQTTVINLCNETIPLQDGWHPYFTTGVKIDETLLRFNAAALVEFDEELIPTGHLLPYTVFNENKRVGNAFLDNCFLLNDQMSGAACTLTNPMNGVQISFYPDGTYPYLQVYTPAHRNSIAIENLSAAPNCFNNKMGLILLAPRYTQTFTVHYQVTIS